MDDVLTITVAGDPIGKARPRLGRSGVYTPAKTAQGESRIAWAAKSAMRGQTPITGPVAVTIEALFAKPRSWSKAKRQAAYHHTSRPDSDNLAKLVLDACNGIVWADDAQVSRLTVVKVYTDGPPCVVLTICHAP